MYDNNSKEKDKVFAYTNFVSSKNYANYKENIFELPILQEFEIYKKANLGPKTENVNEVKKLLKRLVERNLDMIYISLLKICYTDPISVIDTFIENILLSNTIQFLLEKLLTKFPVFFQKIFYFHTLKRYKTFDNFIQNILFTKSFLNFTNFVVTFYIIDKIPINKFVIEKLANRDYVYINLIEKIVVKDSDMSKKCKKYFEKGYTERFLGLKTDEKLKNEICDKYYNLCNNLYGKRKKTYKENSLTGLCECYPSEIAEFAYQFDINKILKEFCEMNSEDFSVLRSVIYFLRARDDFCNAEIIKSMNKYMKTDKQDIKLLLNSFIAMMKNRENQIKMKNDNVQNIKNVEEEYKVNNADAHNKNTNEKTNDAAIKNITTNKAECDLSNVIHDKSSNIVDFAKPDKYTNDQYYPKNRNNDNYNFSEKHVYNERYTDYEQNNYYNVGRYTYEGRSRNYQEEYRGNYNDNYYIRGNNNIEHESYRNNNFSLNNNRGQNYNEYQNMKYKTYVNNNYRNENVEQQRQEYKRYRSFGNNTEQYHNDNNDKKSGNISQKTQNNKYD